VPLPDDVVERLRTVTAGEDGVGGGHGVREAGRACSGCGTSAHEPVIIPVGSGRAKRGVDARRAFACFTLGSKMLRESDPDAVRDFPTRDEFDQRPGRCVAACAPRLKKAKVLLKPGV
jgi:hypothetical protein